MKLKSFAIVLLILLISPLSGRAANVLVDGKEWRQLTDTFALPWTTFQASCDVFTGACTGQFEGWTWAKKQDVYAMWDALAGTTIFAHNTVYDGVVFSELQSSWAPIILGNFERTYVGFGRDIISGFTRDDPIYLVTEDAYLETILTMGNTPESGVEQFTLSDFVELEHSTVNEFGINGGAWMYRLASSVPEPETYAMLLAGLCLMGFVIRRRKQSATST